MTTPARQFEQVRPATVRSVAVRALAWVGLVVGAVFGPAIMVGVIAISHEDTKADRARLDIHNIQIAVSSYEKKTGALPRTMQQLVDADILFERPLDPWDSEYRYQLDGTLPVITSFGKDGMPGGEGNNADLCSNDLRPRS